MKYLIVLLSSLLPLAVLAQSGKQKSKKHVHYFKCTDLPQCITDLGNGVTHTCAVYHFKYSKCKCGAKPTLENTNPGLKKIDITFRKK